MSNNPFEMTDKQLRDHETAEEQRAAQLAEAVKHFMTHLTTADVEDALSEGGADYDLALCDAIRGRHAEQIGNLVLLAVDKLAADYAENDTPTIET